MLTIQLIDDIAKLATERIVKDFSEGGLKNPPKITHGMARAVLEAAQQSEQTDDGYCHCAVTETVAVSPGSLCSRCFRRYL